MDYLSYEVLKSDVSNTLMSVQEQLNSEDFSVHTKEQLESKLNVYQYVDELIDMNHFYKSGY